MEDILQYVVMCAPALAGIGGIIGCIFKVRSDGDFSKNAVKEVVLEAKKAFDQIKDDNEIRAIKDLCNNIVEENKDLKIALMECTEALTRIRNNHPELFAKKDK